MNTINGMKVVRAVTTHDFNDLIIVGTEKQIVMHLVNNPYNHFERCTWINPIHQDVQSKVLIAIDPEEQGLTLVHNIRDSFKNSLKHLECMQDEFNHCAIVRLCNVLYLPAHEEEEAPNDDILAFE